MGCIVVAVAVAVPAGGGGAGTSVAGAVAVPQLHFFSHTLLSSVGHAALGPLLSHAMDPVGSQGGCPPLGSVHVQDGRTRWCHKNKIPNDAMLLVDEPLSLHGIRVHALMFLSVALYGLMPRVGVAVFIPVACVAFALPPGSSVTYEIGFVYK